MTLRGAEPLDKVPTAGESDYSPGDDRALRFHQVPWSPGGRLPPLRGNGRGVIFSLWNNCDIFLVERQGQGGSRIIRDSHLF